MWVKFIDKQTGYTILVDSNRIKAVHELPRYDQETLIVLDENETLRIMDTFEAVCMKLGV